MIQTPPLLDPTPTWGQSLFTGGAGITLLHIERARAGIGDWNTAHAWAAAITRSPVAAHPDVCGLDRGAPAVAFVLQLASDPGYAAALADLDTHITALTRHRPTRAHERIDVGQLPALHEYDLIRGLTGIGVYLLARHAGGDLLRDVLAYLVRLSGPLNAAGQVLPGWWSGNAPDDRPSPRWPAGHGNLGMAHGVAGQLALLSTALCRRITVPGHADAIGRICSWLDQWRSGTADATWWPETVSTAEQRAGSSRQPGPGRPSWCYGTPGLARAEQLAGLALPDPQRRQHAEQALAACLADERQLAQLADATLCHGWAGLLQTSWRVAADAADPDRFPLRYLTRRMDQHLVQHGTPATDDLLEGAAGVRLVQHTLTMNRPADEEWDACLLLAGAGTTPPTSAEPEPAAGPTTRGAP